MKSYLKFLSRNKLYTAIEAVGLAVSLAFVIVIFCYAWQQLSIAREAPDYKRLIERSMETTRNFINLIEIFMVLATLISLLGLVAMSAYYTGMQTRDIAVRKVFGGTVASETGRSVKEYMVLVGIAVLIGIPVAVFLAERYLRQFWYRIEEYGWVFVVGAVIALLISFLAVLWQTLKAAKANPAIELKKE